MSRRLLLSQGSSTYKGPLIYETKTLKNTQPIPSNDSYYVVEDEPVYFMGCSGSTYLGVLNSDGTYTYTIKLISVEDNDISVTTTFTLEQQLTSENDIVYWDDIRNCYVVEMKDIAAEQTLVYETQLNKRIKLKSFKGGTIYSMIDDNGVPRNIDVEIPLRENRFKPYTATYEGTSITIQELNNHIVDSTKSVRLESVTSAEDDPNLVYMYDISVTSPDGKITKTVKVDNSVNTKLPYYGEGTTYIAQRWYDEATPISGFMRVTAPLVYNFPLTYKIFDGREFSISNTDAYCVRHDVPAYLMEVKGDNQLYIDEVNKSYEQVIKLLANRQPDGMYLYTIQATLASGKSKVIPFKMGHMLTWWSRSNPNSDPRPTPETAYETNLQQGVQQDVLYWDDVSNSYKIQFKSEYYYIDSVYSDIYILPGYKGAGSWEFVVDGEPNQDIGDEEAPYYYSNYMISEQLDAKIDDTRLSDYAGIIYPVVNRTNNFPDADDDAIVGFITTAKTLDELDLYLQKNPLHLITASYYDNGLDYPIRDAGFKNNKKLLPITITKDEANRGVTYSLVNGDLNAPIKIAIPVSYYAGEDVPEPTYSLNFPTDFVNNDYVNTGIQLFNEVKDFTILLDYQHNTGNGTYVADDGVILHCRYESTGTSYKRCGLAVENITAPAVRVVGATDYDTNGIIIGRVDNTVGRIKELYKYRYRVMIIYKAGLPHRIIQVGDHGEVYFDYPLQEKIPPFRAHTRPLYLGCQVSTSNSRSKYFKGTINECKVWDGIALSDSQILKAIGGGACPVETFAIHERYFSGSDSVDTGVPLFIQYKTDVDFTIFVDFETDRGASQTSSTPRVLCCTDSTNANEYFSICSDDGSKSFIIKGFDYKTQQYYGLLKNPLPSKNNRYTFFVSFKDGVISSVVDYSTGYPVYLELAESLPPVPEKTLAFYNVLLGAAPFSSMTNTRYNWRGTLDKCVIWRGKALNKFEIEYAMNHNIY